MPTYKQIQEAAGRYLKSCWIAHVKSDYGLTCRQAANRISARKRAQPCPESMRPIIERTFRKLHMI